MGVYRKMVCSARIIIRVLIAFSISLAAFAVHIPSPALAIGMAVSSVTPDANAVDVARNTNITVQFTISVNATTIDEDTFNVDGSLSGMIAGSYDITGDTITFNPAADFQAGETVTVTLTTGIQSTTGLNLDDPVTWQFMVEAPSGYSAFPGGNNFGTGSDRTYSAVLGDVDGDGDLDIVVGNDEQNVVYLGDGDGTFDTTSYNFGTGTDNTLSVALGDVDGDGDLDIVAGNGWEQNVVYLGDGDGTFDTTSHEFGTGADDTFSVALGDVDGDGDLDIVAGNSFEQNVVYLGDGDGTFDTTSHNFGTGTDATSLMALGDVDGDGDLDIVAGNYGEQNVVYLNDGDGTFDTTSYNFGTGVDDTFLVALGDMDGDGDLDIVAGDNGGQNVVYLGDGDGTFDTTSYNFGTGTDKTLSVGLGDVDGDGDLDIVAGNYLNEQNKVYLNDGDGTFDTTSHNFGTGTDATLSVVLGDVDGDGDLDIVAGNYGEQNVVYLNDGLVISSRSPDANALDVDRNTDITVQFNASVNATTVDEDTFNVDGSLSGEIAGIYVVIGDTVTFNPDADFRAGETVTVTLTTGIETNVGGTLAGPVTWQFMVEAPSGYGAFPAGNNFGTGTDAIVPLALGDVDGDGDLDIVVGSYGEQNVVYLNDGDGTFDTTSHNFGTGTDDTWSIALGDMDGDGDLDIVVGNFDGQQNVVYLGDGDGTFDTTSYNFGTGSDDTYSVALGDVDGDGDLDIMVGNDGQNVVYLGDGDGTFDTTSYNFGTGTDNTVSVALGDVDGDGNLDIVVGNYTGQNVVYLNDGDGTFDTTSYNFGTGTDFTDSVALGDVDGDGDLDIVAGNYGEPNVVYLGDGDGTFDTSSHNFGTGTDDTLSVALGDVDGDGDLDIVAGDYQGQNVVYLGDGDGTFDTTSHNFGTGTDWTLPVALGDVDGDGDLDIVAGNYGEQNVVYLNDGLTISSRSPNANALNVAGNTDITVQFSSNINAATVDEDTFNVDGSLSGKIAGIYGVVGDTVTFNPDADFRAGETVTVTLTTGIETNVGGTLAGPVTWQFTVEAPSGYGTFPGGYNFGTGTDDTASLALGDVDGDGDLDIVAGDYQGQNVVYLNDGDGTFDTTSYNFGTGTDDTWSIALGDVDGDGDLDIVAGNFNNDQNVVYLNDGDGTFGTSHNFGTGTDNTYSVALGDVDGDGNLDIVVGDIEGQNVVYLGDGDGTFDTTSHNFGTGFDDTGSVALGDVDGDGNLDIVVGNDEQNVVYLGDGDGTFDTTSHNFGTGTDCTRSVALGDVDGDGDLDIVAGNFNVGQNVVYLGDGDGTFDTTSYNFGTGTDWTYSVALGDVDGDGDLDIVAGNSGPQNVVYLNDGDGTFDTSSYDLSTGTDFTRSVALGDVDGDGDLDIAVGIIGEQNFVYINATIEISLKQSAADIADGGSCDFGSRQTGTNTDVTFTIENTGTWSLTLALPITIGGADASQFSIQAQPASPVAASGNTTFTVRFSPTSAGAKTATISIANDDSDENPYDLTITGIGVLPAPTTGDNDGGPEYHYDYIDMLGERQRLITDSTGRVYKSIEATSADGMLTVNIPQGTVIKDENGRGLHTLNIAVNDNPPPPPEDTHIIGLTYDFGPAGATFTPPITLTFKYDPETLPEGVAEEDLVLAFYDEEAGEWVTLECTVDPETHTITALVSHFTDFAVMVKVKPLLALLSVSDLSVAPGEVSPGRTVTVTVTVTNAGGGAGTCNLILKVNGVREAVKDVTVAAGKAESASFTVSRQEAGTYTIDVNGLEGTFRIVTSVPKATTKPPAPKEEVPTELEETKVTQPSESAPAPTPPLPEAPTVNWAIIGAVVGGVLVVGLLICFIARRRRYS